jgi:aspartyl-tRNA synthetase
VRDHTGAVDVIVDAGEQLRAVTQGSAVDVTATIGAPREGVLRLVLVDLRVVGPAADPPPLGDGAPLDARLDWRYLDLRRPRNRLVFEVQTTLERAMRDWWDRHGFLEVHTPKFRAAPNMSGRELFAVDYFGRPAYLAQSPQFYKQMAMSAGFERVFEIGPVFRANPLITPRHDTEFVSVDVEVAWIDDHEDVMGMEEELLRSAIAEVALTHSAAVQDLFGREIRVPDAPFPRVTMAEAAAIVAGRGQGPTAPRTDLDADGERRLAEHVGGKSGHELVFVTAYPASARPFYHMRLKDGSALTRSFDLLWNGVEITTGGQREHRYERLVAQAERNPARVDVIRPYLDFFRHGCPPHGGFGLGLSRLLMCLLGLDDVRETTFLPRDRHRLTP